MSGVTAPERRYVITFGCPDRTGIIARISGFLAEHGGWIVEAAYHTDPDTGWFFTRQVVRADSLPFDAAELRARFAEVAADLSAESSWQVSDTGERRRAVVLVSKAGHCLYDLLGRVASGELDVDIAAVIGNHESLADITRAHGIPFHHVPFPAGDKAAAFDEVRKLVGEHEPHAVVLARAGEKPAPSAGARTGAGHADRPAVVGARFRQVRPAALGRGWAGRAINTHHSSLPSFTAASPYPQASARGVKLVGATCHYV